MLNIRTVGNSSCVSNDDTRNYSTLELNTLEYHYNAAVLCEIKF